MSVTVRVRPRRDKDMPALVAILERVAADGYPPHVPPNATSSFVQTRHELASFVAEVDGNVVGHVALHDSAAPTVMAAATRALGSRRQLVAVARLFVDPSARRQRAASVLLDAATAEARTLDRAPILDVWEALPNAIALYEAAGWSRIATTTISFNSPCTDACAHTGASIRSYVYAFMDAGAHP